MIWAVTVAGEPAAKGSMKCIGGRGKVRHQLVESDSSGNGKVWRKQVTAAATELRARIGETLDEPLGVAIISTAIRPAAAKNRVHPANRGARDVDKLARMILDAMDDADVYTDDSRVCFLTSTKVYEDGSRPRGAAVFVWRLADGHTAQVMAHLLKLAPELN